MRASVFWAIMLILIGGLLLLDNLGIIDADIWLLIGPLLLIGLGIWIIYGMAAHKNPPVEHRAVALDQASQARVRFRHGAGRLSVQSGTAPGNLVEGDFGGGVVVDSKSAKEQLEVTLRVPSQSFSWLWGPGASLDWEVRLARDLPLELDFETGAGENRLDLSDLLVTDLRFNSGASATEVTLPAAAGKSRAEFKTGVASLRVRLPQGVAARIRTSGGLSNVSVDTNRFSRQGDGYQSIDFDSAENSADIQIETGLGSVDIV